MTEHDDNDTVGRAFAALRADITARVSALPIGEVRARARRRRHHQVLVIAVAPLCLVAAGVGVWAAHGTPGPPAGAPAPPVAPASASTAPTTSATAASGTPTKPASAAPSPRTVHGFSQTTDLPTGYLFNQIATDGGGPQLVGTDGSGKSCATAPVASAPLRIGPVHPFECPNSEAALQIVVPVITYGSKHDTATVSIAVTNTRTHVTATGPVVMTYSPASDANPVIAYGEKSLWIYDVATTSGPRVIEVSGTTGQVEGTVATPQLVRPILAADTHGLWLGNSIQGTDGPALLHIGAGTHIVTSVLPDTNSAIDWLTTDGIHLWAGVRGRDGVDETLWRFDSASTHPVFHIAEPGLFASSVVGDETDGLWTALPYPSVAKGVGTGTNTELDVVRIDPDTGERSLQAVLSPLDTLDAEQGIRPGSAVYTGGAYYLLLPPFRQGGYLGYSTVARITPGK